MPKLDLRRLYADPRKVVITAHRGFSARYPENTMPSFRAALELGADILEFDLRGTRDRVPVILHDATLDRTSDATGSPNACTLVELKRHNFSFWKGPQVGGGRRLSQPARRAVTIPSFQELLDALAGKIGLNIQVYETEKDLLKEICRLYREYDLYASGYLMMSTYREAELVRRLDPKIVLCVGEDQGRMNLDSLRRQQAFGCRYIQPGRDDMNAEFCRQAKSLGLLANMFYSNTDADNRKYIGLGLRGILTDYPDRLKKTVTVLRAR